MVIDTEEAKFYAESQKEKEYLIHCKFTSIDQDMGFTDANFPPVKLDISHGASPAPLTARQRERPNSSASIYSDFALQELPSSRGTIAPMVFLVSQSHLSTP